MKRFLSLSIIAFASVLMAFGDSFYYNGIKYNTISLNTVEVTYTSETLANYSKINATVIIPNNVEYNGKTYIVVSIGKNAFHDCSGIKSITIPNSVTSIGSYAFVGCGGLTSITIPSSVIYIEEGAFHRCSGLTSVTIPNSVKKIGNYAFQNCSGLSVTILCRNVGNWFENCNSIKEVFLGDEVVSIGNNAFYCCESLSSLTIGNGVTSIGNDAFRCCSGLTSITIPNSVTSIGDGAFAHCSGLTSITIGKSVTSIGSAFYGCSGLTSVTILCREAGIWVGNYNSIKEIILGNEVVAIISSAFKGCSGLTSITIPNSVTHIGDYAFEGCSGLTSVAIPNSVTRIGNNAFYGCSGLTSITISNSVTRIGSYAFYGCDCLISVTSLNTTPPPIVSYTFSNYNATLYVPTGCKTVYESHQVWSKFTNIVEIDASNIQYTLTYLVDGEVYKTYKLKVGDAITPETEPAKEGYTFSGWSEIPSTMPDHDVTVSGTFTKNGSGTDDDNPSNYKSLDDYIANSNTTLQNYSYTINPIIKNIKKVYIDLTKGTTNSAYCYIPICNENNAKRIDFSSKYLQSTSTDNLVIDNNTRRAIKNVANNKTYSWLYYNPQNSNEVIIDVEAYFGCVGHINGWQRYFGTSCIVNIVTESTETSVIPIESDSEDKDNKYYNLQGQRVLYPRNGIYIKNGKKIFIK